MVLFFWSKVLFFPSPPADGLENAAGAACQIPISSLLLPIANPVPTRLRANGAQDPQLCAPLVRSSCVCRPPLPKCLPIFCSDFSAAAAVQRHTLPASPAGTSRSSGSGGHGGNSALPESSPLRWASPSTAPRPCAQPRPAPLFPSLVLFVKRAKAPATCGRCLALLCFGKGGGGGGGSDRRPGWGARDCAIPDLRSGGTHSGWQESHNPFTPSAAGGGGWSRDAA